MIDDVARNLGAVAAARAVERLAASEGRGGGSDLWGAIDPGEVGHAEGGEHLHGLLVDADLVDLQGGLLRDEVHAALALLLLQLEGDAADWSALDAAHEMGGEAGNLVPQTLGREDGDLLQHLLVGVEVQGHARVVLLDHLPGGLLHGLGADATHGCGCCSLLFSGGGGGGWALVSGAQKLHSTKHNQQLQYRYITVEKTD